MRSFVLQYATFRFKPPALDGPLTDALRQSSLEELREHLRRKSRQEWSEAFARFRPMIKWIAVWFGICVAGIAVNPKGEMGGVIVACIVAWFLALFGIAITAAHYWEYQFKRWLWFKKAKKQIDRADSNSARKP